MRMICRPSARQCGPAVLAAAVLLAGSVAYAADCLETAYGADTNCTANDFTVSLVRVVNVDANDCGGVTNTFTFDGEFDLAGGSADRYDVGFYIGSDGSQALTGTGCVVSTIPAGTTLEDPADGCGDYGGDPVVIPVENVTVACNDIDGDGFFDLPLCTAWSQNGNEVCNGPADAIPGTSSKCDCAVINTDVEIPECATNAECADDANVCTDAVCVGIGEPGADSFGCAQVNNTAPCDDGQFCNGTDVCAGGTCGHSGDPCAGGGVCGDECNEAEDDCFVLAGTPCRFAAGVCDQAETCTGSSEDCPADDYLDSGECRASAGPCDAAESCEGASPDCPADGFADAGTPCRAAAGECDVAEQCTGASAACPADGYAADGVACTGDGNVCTDDACDGSGACAHEPNTAPCNDGAFCTQNDACSGGSCGGDPVVCDDGIACTDDSCDEGEGGCVAVEDDSVCDDEDTCTADVCSIDAGGCLNEFVCGTDICRSPGFWSTHSGYEKSKPVNVGQELLDLRGPFEVCGQTISATSNPSSPYLDGLGLTSSLEGLCMRTRGVKQRQLYRQLVAAKFNCELSGSSDCDAITGKYIEVAWSDCSDLCAGNPPADPPSVTECISQLDCFNNGGQVVGGQCARGTCEAQPELYCGGDYGSCPDFSSQPQACVRFPDNCHDEPLCNEGMGFCPGRTRATSPWACREARKNDCTIDSCF